MKWWWIYQKDKLKHSFLVSGVRACNTRTHVLIKSISLVNDALKNLILAVACSIFGLISGMALSTPSLISPVLSVDHSLTSQDYTYFGVTARLAELPIVKRTLLRCFVTNDDSQRLDYVTRNTEMCNLATAWETLWKGQHQILCPIYVIYILPKGKEGNVQTYSVVARASSLFNAAPFFRSFSKQMSTIQRTLLRIFNFSKLLCLNEMQEVSLTCTASLKFTWNFHFVYWNGNKIERSLKSVEQFLSWPDPTLKFFFFIMTWLFTVIPLNFVHRRITW